MTLKDKYLNLSLTKKTVIIAASTFFSTLAVLFIAGVGLFAYGGYESQDSYSESLDVEQEAEAEIQYIENTYPVKVVQDNPEYPVTALVKDSPNKEIALHLMVKNLQGENQEVKVIINDYETKLIGIPTSDDYLLQQIEAKHGVKVEFADDSYYFIDRYETTKEDKQLVEGKDKNGEEGLYLLGLNSETFDFTFEEVETSPAK